MLSGSGSKRLLEEDDNDTAKGIRSQPASHLDNMSLLSTGNGRNLNDLPSEVIAEILSKLDAQSFLEARGVCKLWRACTTKVLQYTKKSPLENYEVKLRDWYEIEWYIDAVARHGTSLGSPFPSGAACFTGFALHFVSTDTRPYYQTHVVSIHERFLSVCGSYIQHLGIEQMKISKKSLLTILACPVNLKSLRVKGSWIAGEPVTDHDWSRIRVDSLQKLRMQMQVLVEHKPDQRKADIITKWKALAADFEQGVNGILKKCNGKKLVVLEVIGVDITSDVFLKKYSEHPTSNSSKDLEPKLENCIQNSIFYSQFTKMEKLSLDVGSELVLISSICSLPYSNLKELSIEFYTTETITYQHLEQLAKFKTLRILSIAFQHRGDQSCFQRNEFKNFRLQLDELRTLRMICFLGHLDFVVSLHKTLETLDLSHQDQKIQTLFNNRRKFFDFLPKLHKITVGPCTVYRV